MYQNPLAKEIIFIDKISKWYHQIQVLFNCSLKVYQGDIVVICGPSGSGKSTLLQTINALQDFQEGDIFVNGESLKTTNLKALRSKIGMVFQNFELFPHLSVMGNLTLAQIKVLKKSKKEAFEIAEFYLNKVGLIAHKDKYPSQLSGGQQQRVAIARALCMNLKIMLFDEPTSALDPEMVNEVLNVILSLAQDGMTMLCVTHEMKFAENVSNRIVFMDGGYIIDDCKTKDFFHRDYNRSPRAKEFLSKVISN